MVSEFDAATDGFGRCESLTLTHALSLKGRGGLAPLPSRERLGEGEVSRSRAGRMPRSAAAGPTWPPRVRSRSAVPCLRSFVNPLYFSTTPNVIDNQSQSTIILDASTIPRVKPAPVKEPKR